MKKARSLPVILLLVLLSLIARPACAEAPRKLTLMIYMCGSNLESSYGSASADIQEMLDTDFDSEQVTLLVMTGGSEDWSHGLGFDPANLTIFLWHHVIPSRNTCSHYK